jgi:hypothetical protein
MQQNSSAAAQFTCHGAAPIPCCFNSTRADREAASYSQRDDPPHKKKEGGVGGGGGKHTQKT